MRHLQTERIPGMTELEWRQACQIKYLKSDVHIWMKYAKVVTIIVYVEFFIIAGGIFWLM